ncbi:ATP-binding protein [Sphingomonas sp. NSE70-1]|uniref:histidine kinase n=1 Tax=Sphingomonas caseinilyticus TaxID=2908205 RepID=A0ABT0RS76_9SPHN|nr:sensor histidine kinase [Sphingomonas caseinilyticus]MCL6697864.1 ATP-binding protein [Sphingomonas caseinilyticus]
MGFRRRFEFGLAWRTLVLMLAIWLFMHSLSLPDLRAARLVAAFVAFAALASLWQFIRRTNFQVARFIESVRFEDYSQRFSDPSGGGFDVLGDTLDAALKALQARHVQASGEARYLSAIVDDSPSALLSVDKEGRVELLNKAARQLFARQPLTRREDLLALGAEMAAAADLPPGTRKITRLMIDGIPHRAIFASAQVARLDGGVTILSILPVQSELGALEVAAQADLVRVLTHEIMNSLTPVTSLARTSAEMVASAEQQGADLGDVRVATETVARRAEGILRFVESYREFAQTPEVRRRSFMALPWAEELLRLALANADERHAGAALEVVPETLKISADPELLAQALLNLLRNAFRITADVADPVVVLAITRQAGSRFRIEVRDNGPGIPAERREDVFLPFYTTHKGGSGVGLSFARQVALAHGGSISAGDSPEGGASIALMI